MGCHFLLQASPSGSDITQQCHQVVCLVSVENMTGENPPLSSLTWWLAGLRSFKPIQVTIGGFKVLDECWPEVIAPVYLGLSIELLTTSCKFPQRQQRREETVQVEDTVSL